MTSKVNTRLCMVFGRDAELVDDILNKGEEKP